jgi:arginase
VPSHSRGKYHTRVAVLGAPNASGQRRAGVERAPAILRAAGILDDIRSLGWDVDDLGDAHAPKPPVPSPPHGPPPTSVRKTNAWGDADAAALHSAVADRVHDALASGSVPLILGGDHSVSIGSVAGALRHDPRLSVVWIDAHADVNSPEMSETGNFHGMSLAMVAGLAAPASWPDGAYDWLLKDDDSPGAVGGAEDDNTAVRRQPKLNLKRVVYIGLRDVDKAERELIERLGIKAFTAEDVRNMGARDVARLAIEHLRFVNGDAEGGVTTHVSLDVDSLDPIFMKATGTPVADGLVPDDVASLLDEIRLRSRVTSVDLVELNVDLVDEGERAGYVDTARGLARALLGEAGCESGVDAITAKA